MVASEDGVNALSVEAVGRGRLIRMLNRRVG